MANSYKHRWGLRLHGVKESNQQEDTHSLAIKILSNVSLRIAEKLPEVVDSAHGIGRNKEDNSTRAIIVQFSMCLY